MSLRDRPTPFAPVPADTSLPKIEHEVLALWDAQDTFARSLEQTREGPLFSFYDGPPFATGLPHYGHLLAGTIKDIVPRYWTMRGHHVPRRFGWDTHGLPVEQEINKQLGVSTRREVIELGVATYNEACRGIVKRYTAEWKQTVRRVGRWVDMENAYFTMDPGFMQSVWWVFKSLWDKGLIYEGYKVVPYSVGISSPLSNFESRLNMRENVQDPSLTVAFSVVGEDDLVLLAWTTTPWTLPSNMALAVSRAFTYARVREAATGRRYILAAARIDAVFPKREGVEVEAEFSGEALLGMRYAPLFSYFADKADEGAFRVIHADHVTLDTGSGIVHIAPAFGEEDYVAARKNGVPLVNPVDDDGQFTAEVPDYQGRGVKAADADIIARLKREGRVLRHETFAHNYPFCYRTDTPLIYRAVSSWFVRVESMRDRLMASNADTRWVPESLRDGRFGNWLADARDWAISRNRFWGTPIPVWRNDEGETVCVGSIEELERLSGQRVTDLHAHHVDDVLIPSPTGRSPLRRIAPVLDCWFESGAMPYAQANYPFENAETFGEGFPAQFIAEGIDQTRGWFYTLTVLGTALFDRSPFRNVIVNGIVLNEKGEKMSKRLRNYPEPAEMLETAGADALRLYLIDSPVVAAEDLKFSERGVRETVRKILLRWWNAYAFFVTYSSAEGFAPAERPAASPNLLDRWILSRLNTLSATVNREMEAYRLFAVVPALLRFIEELTNTYIRLSRGRFSDGADDEKAGAFETLYEVLCTLARLMAPFTPFITEAMWQNLRRGREGMADSVHLAPYPQADESLRDATLEEAVARMEELLVMGRNLREKIRVRTRVPLRSLTVIHRDPRVLDALRPLERDFADELNVLEVRFESNEDALIEVRCKANFKRLGARLGKRMKDVAAGIALLDLDALRALEAGATAVVAGEEITAEDVEIRRAPRDPAAALATGARVSIALDPEVTEAQRIAGAAREVQRRVQAARKSARLSLRDRVRLTLTVTDDLREALEAHGEALMRECGVGRLELVERPEGDHVEWVDEDELHLGIGITVIPAAE
ncbi:MAG: isoleucine--tRNA ligase [Polyangiales bacterium]